MVPFHELRKNRRVRLVAKNCSSPSLGPSARPFPVFRMPQPATDRIDESDSVPLEATLIPNPRPSSGSPAAFPPANPLSPAACKRLTGARLFDADQAARQLTDEDEEVQRLLRERFGIEIFSANGDLNRGALRAIVFADSEKKRALEQILHPRIRQQWSTAAEESRQSGQLFLADIPLLYETQGEFLCDRVVVVACSQEIQQQRLISRACISRPLPLSP